MVWPQGMGAYAMSDGSIYLHDGSDAIRWEYRNGANSGKN
jgi:hypothetical protein